MHLAAVISPRNRLLTIGILAFAVVIASWWTYDALAGTWAATHAVDLTVYRDGGLIVRQVKPYYNGHYASPLYDWGGYSADALKFTYTPFAAIAFALLSFMPPGGLLTFSVIVNMASVAAALWFAFGALGLRPWRRRLGVTLIAAAITFWLQPNLRTIYLGQVNLVLMAGILWDLCQPGEGRWWKGFVTGIAAGIKLTPLIFVPYLLITRRFREAAVTVAGFAFTIIVGFIVLPRDSALWWLHGLFIGDGTRAGFIGWAGNQSLRAIITRFAGSVTAGQNPWLVAAFVAFAIGMAVAYYLDRAGYRLLAILATALTGLLISPISWDHHWVWVTPGLAVTGYYIITNRKTAPRLARGLMVLSALIIIIFYGPWPDAIWEQAQNLGKFSLGWLWAPPNTNPQIYAEHGDRPSYVEYHWHGVELFTGNAYIIGGLILMLVLASVAWRLRKTRVADRPAPRVKVPLMRL